jgi:hypothetical protein
MGGEPEDDRVHQVLVERGPRTRRWMLVCLGVSLVGLLILVATALTSTGSPWDTLGVVLFVPFGAMAANGAFWAWRRQRGTSR